MNRTLLAAASSLLALSFTAAGAATAQTAASTPTAAPQSEAARQLHALFKKSDEDNLRRNPIGALFRGDMRYADRLGDYLTDEYFAAVCAVAAPVAVKESASNEEAAARSVRFMDGLSRKMLYWRSNTPSRARQAPIRWPPAQRVAQAMAAASTAVAAPRRR